MKQMKHWQDPVNAMLGVWLIVSPWAVGFAADQVAMLNFVVVGVLLIAAATGAIFVPRAWEEWVEVALGAWMVVSPWILGYADFGIALQNGVLVGLAVTLLALGVLATDRDFGGWRSGADESTRIP